MDSITTGLGIATIIILCILILPLVLRFAFILIAIFAYYLRSKFRAIRKKNNF